MLVSVQIAMLVSTSAALSVRGGVRFRRGERGDEFVVASTLARQLMNPLSVSAERFVVAVDHESERLGWAQCAALSR